MHAMRFHAFRFDSMGSFLRRRVGTVLLCLLIVGVGAPIVKGQTPITTIENGESVARFELTHNGGLLVPGTLIEDGTEHDSIPATGAGTRLMWYPEKAAFRVGEVGALSGHADNWDASNVGDHSVAFGEDTQANADYATAMGRRTTASGFAATTMGLGTTASSELATAMGNQTTASGPRATAMGSETTAGGFYATAMGRNTTASGDESTAMGRNTVASGSRATAVGRTTTAATNVSLSIGECNDTNTSGDGSLFVAGNGASGFDACDSRSDALVLDKSGNMSIAGVFEAASAGNTFAGHFQGDKNAVDGEAASHIAMVENVNTGADADGLAVTLGASVPGTSNNYITFFDGDGNAAGSIQGDADQGVIYNTSGADFAEELPIEAGAVVPEPGDLVGVSGGQISLDTGGADRVMVVSKAPGLLGNTTPSTDADDARRLAVAFVGQVSAKVRGQVDVGDLVVASGNEDGTARAVAPTEYRRSAHGPIAGQAWSSKATTETGEVTVAVGLGQSGAVSQQLQRQRATIDSLRDRVQQIENLESRVERLEARSSGSLPASTSVPRVLLGLVLGGVLAAGLFWRRRG